MLSSVLVWFDGIDDCVGETADLLFVGTSDPSRTTSGQRSKQSGAVLQSIGNRKRDPAFVSADVADILASLHRDDTGVESDVIIVELPRL